MGHQMPWETGLIPWHPACAVPIWHDSGLIHSNKTKPNKPVSTNISLKRFCFGDKISLHSPGSSNIYLFSGDEDEDDDGPRGICHSEVCVQDRVKLVTAISTLLLCEDWGLNSGYQVGSQCLYLLSHLKSPCLTSWRMHSQLCRSSYRKKKTCKLQLYSNGTPLLNSTLWGQTLQAHANLYQLAL